jgi:hypothetical protein
MQATVIDPADVGALESALNENNVSNEDSGLVDFIRFFIDYFANDG